MSRYRFILKLQDAPWMFNVRSFPELLSTTSVSKNSLENPIESSWSCVKLNIVAVPSRSTLRSPTEMSSTKNRVSFVFWKLPGSLVSTNERSWTSRDREFGGILIWESRRCGKGTTLWWNSKIWNCRMMFSRILQVFPSFFHRPTPNLSEVAFRRTGQGGQSWSLYSTYPKFRM